METVIFREEPVGMLTEFAWRGDVPTAGKPVAAFAAVDAAVQAALREHGIVGAGVALLRGRDIIYNRAFGWAEIEKTPFTPATTCRLGSLSKSITGVVLLALVQDGKVSLDDLMLPHLARLGITLPKEKLADARIERITLRHLLDHTSGFPRSSPYHGTHTVAEGLGKKVPVTAADVCRYALGAAKLAHEPGEVHEYANLNFDLLGRVVESVTGKGYEETVRALVLNPMRIAPDEVFVSRFLRAPDDPARRPNEARYYQRNSQKHRSILPEDNGTRRMLSEPYGGWDPTSMEAAGGWAASAAGFAKLVANLYHPRGTLKASARKELLTPPAYADKEGKTFPNRQHYYAMGLTIHQWRGFPQYEHGGMLQHAGAYFGPLDAEYSVVLVSNCNLTDGPWVDSRLKDAVRAGLSKSLGRG
jgi:CubicO group peptidase (beta-lactamase class C family)